MGRHKTARKTYNLPRVEQVIWLDHSGDYDHNAFKYVSVIAARAKEEIRIATVGYVVYEDKNRVTLAKDFDVSDVREGAKDYTHILKPLILERRVILKE